MTYAFLDTSILMQYKVFEGMPWADIIGDKDFQFVVSQKVFDEIDKHKDGPTMRMRRRARIVNKHLLGYLDGKPTTPFKIIFCPNPSTASTTQSYFDSSSADEYIVYSALEYNSNGSRKVIITGDGGMKLRASKVKLDVIILDDRFRLSEEKTEEEKKILELEKRLATYKNACAKPVLSFSQGEAELHYDKVEKPGLSNLETEIRQKLEQKYPHKTYPEVDYYFNYFEQIAAMRNPMLTKEDYERYNSILPKFYDTETRYKYLSEIADFINGNMIPLHFEVSNSGKAKSGSLGLYLRFPQNAKVYSKSSKVSYRIERVQPPELKSNGVPLFNIDPARIPGNTFNDFVDTWDLENPTDLSKQNEFFFSLDPAIHNVPPVEVLKDEFFIYLGDEQELEIKWKLCDEQSPNIEEGTLKISVS